MRTLKKAGSYDGPTISKKDKGMENLMSELSASAVKTHFAHLSSTSYAAHMALAGYYEAIPDMMDGLAEQYQGVIEKLLIFPTVSLEPIKTTEEAIIHLRAMYDLVNEVQAGCDYSEIINDLDLVKSCINKTKYKLIFLK